MYFKLENCKNPMQIDRGKEQFFLAVSQNNFGNKIAFPNLPSTYCEVVQTEWRWWCASFLLFMAYLTRIDTRRLHQRTLYSGNERKKFHTHCLDLDLNGKRPGIVFVILVHTWLVEADTTVSCHFLWAEMEGCTIRAWPIQPISRFLVKLPKWHFLTHAWISKKFWGKWLHLKS